MTDPANVFASMFDGVKIIGSTDIPSEKAIMCRCARVLATVDPGSDFADYINVVTEHLLTECPAGRQHDDEQEEMDDPGLSSAEKAVRLAALAAVPIKVLMDDYPPRSDTSTGAKFFISMRNEIMRLWESGEIADDEQLGLRAIDWMNDIGDLGLTIALATEFNLWNNELYLREWSTPYEGVMTAVAEVLGSFADDIVTMLDNGEFPSAGTAEE